jgi:hypothetical protein
MDRTRSKRTVVAMVAAAGAMVAAVQAASGTDPASAGCIWVGSDCIEEVVVTAPPYDPGPGRDDPGGSENDPEQGEVADRYRNEVPSDLLEAFIAADVALADGSECAALIVGPEPPFIYHLDHVRLYVPLNYVLRTAIVRDDPSSPVLPVPDGPPSPVYAEATRNHAGIGEDLILYSRFHTIVHDPSFYPGLQLNGAVPQPHLVQAMVILHEVAHMTGKLPPHVRGETSDAFNREIMDKCLGF